jgi:predicted TIM-barrel fold metal-dependent hydrolase
VREEENVSKERPVCLIVVTALRFSPEYGEAALESARARDERVVIELILDPDVPEAVAARLAEAGFLGERLMHELRDTVAREYRERGHENLDTLVRRASELGMGVQTRTAQGPFVDTVREEAARCGADRVLAAQQSSPPLPRVLFETDVDRLRRSVACPVEVFDLSGELVPSRSGPLKG